MFIIWRAGYLLAHLTLLVSLFAQDGQRRFRLTGEVVADSGALPGGLTVEVHDINGRVPIEKVAVQDQGSFEASNLTTNQVELRLVSFDGVVLRAEHVNLLGGPAPVRLRLPSFGGSSPVRGTVSVSRLRHVPVKTARKLYNRSIEAAAKGDTRRSLDLLQAAVAEDPEYLEAWNNIGSRHMRDGNPELALDALRRAQSLDADSPHVLTNLGVVLMHLKQREEAETVSRRALRHARNDTKAEYVLGLCLFHKAANFDEAIFYLKKAKDEFPQARLSIAHILVRAGRIPEARQELENYLDVTSERKEFVQQWLAALPKGTSR
ncbi:MAG: tetratricopeptide repeat protein [Bryobacterales bacterium]|nr:tetratricopeptide repeat protein [Bryobacterales bacterium]